MKTKIISKILTFINLYLLKPNYAKKNFQPIFQYLYNVSISGMNYGLDGKISEITEINLLKMLNKYIKDQRSMCLFDIGANVGQYTKKLLEYIPYQNKSIHCFEPSRYTFGILFETYKQDSQIKLNNFGLSDKKGQLELYKNFEGSGLSSLYNRQVFNHNAIIEVIDLETLDEYCKYNNIDQIDFMKMDVEGNEFKILLGAKEMIKNNRIKVIQFEFGGCNIDSKVFFADLFNLLKQNFSIFRLLEDGIQEMPSYSENYETFYYSNYIAVNKTVNILLE